MKIVDTKVNEIVFHTPEGYTVEQWLERAGRTCYKSEEKITSESAPKFIRRLRGREHYGMFEHAMISVVCSVERGISHEWVRHRLASYLQESSRYCNYSKGKFGNEITVVAYPWKGDAEDVAKAADVHVQAAKAAETYYNLLLDLGQPPELARAVLPISLKTDIVVSANLRQWFTMFGLRCDSAAHPMIRGLMKNILGEFENKYPVIFETQAERFLTNDI